MRKLRPSIIGFVLGGAIFTKLFELVGQSTHSNSIDLLSIGMITGGVAGAVIGFCVSKPNEVEIKQVVEKRKATESLRKSA